MNNLTLFNLINHETVSKWRDEIEKADENNFCKNIDKYWKLLSSELNEYQIGLLERLNVSITDKFDNIIYTVGSKLLNLGIKIGMELQEAFDEKRD